MNRKIKRIILNSIGKYLLVVGATTFIYGCDRRFPTDADMEKAFSENRSDFDRIVRMSNEDSNLTNIRYTFTVVEGKGSSSDTGDVGLSEERWDEYRKLFKKIGLQSGIVRGDDGSIHFLAFGVSGGFKGYFYSTSDPPIGNIKCTDESLEIPGRLQNIKFICKNLDDNWYLFLN